MAASDETGTKFLYEESWEGRAILLVDLDAFYASVEQLDHPEWRGKPVVVGSPSALRGVVSTASYEARAYGVRSAMASSVAERLCPQAIWAPPRHRRYKEVSDQVMAFLRDETPYVQQVSIDEAFMDVTPTRVNTEHPVAVAQRVQAHVASLGVSCSIGVATTKTVAKIASEQGKPKGLTVVYPGREARFLHDLPVCAMSGIGGASVESLHRFGIKTLGQLACADEAVLKKVFGKNASLFRLRALGQERSKVEVERVVKSISHETSFAQELCCESDLLDTLFTLSEKVGKRLREKGFIGTTVTLKLRFSNRKIRTAQEKMELPTNNELVFFPHAAALLKTLWTPGIPVRLIGVSVSALQKLSSDEEVPFSLDVPQASLFDGEFGDAAPCVCAAHGHNSGTAKSDGPVANEGLSEQRRRKLQSLVAVSDQVNNRFGSGSIQYGRTKKSR